MRCRIEEPWVERLDLDSGGLAETSFVSATHESRASDVIWKFRRLMASEPAAAWRKLPLIVPVLLYNGSERWSMATDLGSSLGDLDLSAETYRPRLRYRLVDEAAYPL
jgi:Putative transposase, YhgA-like